MPCSFVNGGGVTSFNKDNICSRHGFDFEASYGLSPEGHNYNWREVEIGFLRRGSEFNNRDYGRAPKDSSAIS
ncbi:hypothetical protein DL768_007053 [Monosporascus sp. mg162]|nr:hypothetical protein DL768_007053 [Monosporascus sp. mg162]